ncbi:MAG: glycosyltransferase family 4 protein [Pseudohongiellaceae bacterium]
MTASTLYFAFPGDLDTPTGGYHYDRRLIGELRAMGLDVHTLPLSDRFPFPDASARNQARQTLRALPDGAVVIVDGLAFGALDELAAAETQRLRLIALCHHPLALEAGLDAAQQQAFLASERRALLHTRAVVVTSEHTRQILAAEYGVPADRIAVACPGTDRTPFSPCDGDPVRLLTVASLTQRKGHDLLIDALAPLTALPWQARFVGGMDFNPAWAEELRQRVNRLHLQSRIHLVGAVDDLQAEYRTADVFVLPSRFEGYGMVFAEALAAGLPVIATRAGAVPDVVPDTAGLLVAPEDTQALSEALRSLLTRPDLRRQLQAGARGAAASLPTWSDSARRIARLIEEVQQQ